MINFALGCGFGHDRDSVNTTFEDIDGDFGIPTDADIAEFKQALAAIQCANKAELIARTISIEALELYVEIVNR